MMADFGKRRRHVAQALKQQGVDCLVVTSPANWYYLTGFMGEAGALVVVPPPVKAGDYVVLTAEVDTVVVFSACPMDVFPTNGPDCTPKPVAFQVQRGA